VICIENLLHPLQLFLLPFVTYLLAVPHTLYDLKKVNDLPIFLQELPHGDIETDRIVCPKLFLSQDWDEQ
jgi:hypothetical protein